MRTLLCGAVLAPVLAASAWAQKGPGREPGPPGMEDDRDMPPKPPLAFDQAEADKLMEFLKENAPEMYKDLENLREKAPDVFKRKLFGFGPIMHDADAQEMFKRNAKVEAEVRRVLQAVKKAKGSEKDALRGDLEKALGEQFDARLAQQEFKLKKMQEEVSNIKSRIDKRRALKEKIVKKHAADMLGDLESWEW
jgi:hypothetical protein